MIPKIIHYCWFGGAPLGEKELQCIDRGRNFAPNTRCVDGMNRTTIFARTNT